MQSPTTHFLPAELRGFPCTIVFKYSAPASASLVDRPGDSPDSPDVDFERVIYSSPEGAPFDISAAAVAYLASAEGFEAAVERAREDRGEA